jgi:hypothetical protein
MSHPFTGDVPWIWGLHTLLQFAYEVPLKRLTWRLGDYLIDTIIERRLDHELSNLINELTHKWVDNLMALLRGGGNFWKCGLDAWSMRGGCVPLKGSSYVQTLRFPTAIKWAILLCPSAQMVCLTIGPETQNLAITDWNFWSH